MKHTTFARHPPPVPSRSALLLLAAFAGAPVLAMQIDPGNRGLFGDTRSWRKPGFLRGPGELAMAGLKTIQLRPGGCRRPD